MQKCRNCGAEMPDDANKCSECGRQITKSLLSSLVEEAHESLVEKQDNGGVATSVQQRQKTREEPESRSEEAVNTRVPFLASIFCVLCTLLTAAGYGSFWIIGFKFFLFLQLLIFVHCAFLLKKRSELSPENERTLVVGAVISGISAFIFLMILGMSLFDLVFGTGV